MNLQLNCNKCDKERLLNMGCIDPQEWANESSRLYLVIKLLFDKSFLST
jgi:hypothetical protein